MDGTIIPFCDLKPEIQKRLLKGGIYRTDIFSKFIKKPWRLSCSGHGWHSGFGNNESLDFWQPEYNHLNIYYSEEKKKVLIELSIDLDNSAKLDYGKTLKKIIDSICIKDKLKPECKQCRYYKEAHGKR